MNNPKYKSVLKTSEKLFWKYGVKRVSIEEICKESKVSKMTFYKFFPNKIELAKTILNKIVDESLIKFNQIVKSEATFSKKLQDMFLMKLDGMNNISIEFVNDIYNNPESGLMSHMQELQQKSMNIITDFYTDSQKKGFIRKDVKIDFILAYSNQIVKFMENKHLVSQYEKPQDLIIESMNLLFYGIISKNE